MYRSALSLGLAVQLARLTVGHIWQIAHLIKCAAHLIKRAHLTSLHTCAAFRHGKVQGWIKITVWVGVRIMVGVSVRVRVMVRALIKFAFARRAAHFVKCAD